LSKSGKINLTLSNGIDTSVGLGQFAMAAEVLNRLLKKSIMDDVFHNFLGFRRRELEQYGFL
jgi:hypothetical protein